MPAEDPVCARAGRLPSASAAATVSATARDAGFTGRTLLGGLAAVIWDKVAVPRSGDQGSMDGTGCGQHKGRRGQRLSETPQNPPNTAVPGRPDEANDGS